VMKYVYAGTSRIARAEGVSGSAATLIPTAFYLHDHLGSTAMSLSGNAEVAEQMVNYPYGSPRLEHQKLAQSDYRFTGKERDKESGLQYFEARYYDNVLCTFISSDTIIAGLDNTTLSIRKESDVLDVIKYPQKISGYRYGLDNPINNIDRDGNWTDPVTWDIRTSTNNPNIGRFGLVRRYENGQPKPHQGVDLVVSSCGTKVVSALGGKVVLAEKREQMGNTVVVETSLHDGSKKYLTYGHLASLSVKEGMLLTEGDEIGTVGNTGRTARGEDPHLHLEVRDVSMKETYYGGLNFREDPNNFKGIMMDKKTWGEFGAEIKAALGL